MKGMESSNWRHYRQHLILASQSWPFGRRRFEVWHCSRLLGTFRDVVAAELHVDARLAGQEGEATPHSRSPAK